MSELIAPVVVVAFLGVVLLLRRRNRRDVNAEEQDPR
ncbi:hypothetical protein BJY24_005663 [Nocardia transvalensis]|uniref:Uncharacterized protein n=1 Tax=Nocardia transvalensis TaxID=37333 RepID=A0A7W9PIF8_9NOCA|nr:hypothetical protein [Nocardia transvalensis]